MNIFGPPTAPKVPDGFVLNVTIQNNGADETVSFNKDVFTALYESRSFSKQFRKAASKAIKAALTAEQKKAQETFKSFYKDQASTKNFRASSDAMAENALKSANISYPHTGETYIPGSVFVGHAMETETHAIHIAANNAKVEIPASAYGQLVQQGVFSDTFYKVACKAQDGLVGEKLHSMYTDVRKHEKLDDQTTPGLITFTEKAKGVTVAAAIKESGWKKLNPDFLLGW